jgi:alkylated DNA repair dioxygenase AlkB
MERQASLFGREPLAIDASFKGIERIDLGLGAWIDVARAWVAGHAELFRALEAVHWRSEERAMYERTVAVPRLIATAKDAPSLPILDEMRDALDRRYGEHFERLSFAFYRDGNDSVAWHGDYVARRLPTATVATISVGAPRRFLLRPTGGGPSRALSLGWGDLLVMGGTCQRTWQHAIQKVARAEPRIAIMFRPVWTEP